MTSRRFRWAPRRDVSADCPGLNRTRAAGSAHRGQQPQRIGAFCRRAKSTRTMQAKTILFWVLILATAVLLYNVGQYTASGREQAVPFSRFLQEVERGNVKEVTIADSDVKGKLDR